MNINDYNHSFNIPALSSYLSFRYVIGKQTFYKNIFDVLPGSQITYNGEKTTENQYWDIPTEIEQDQGIEYYLSELDKLIDGSVKKQMISDVPLGAFISGGLDSSLLLSYIKKYKSNIKTYITGFEENGYNEFDYAETVADHLNLYKPKKLKINQNEYIDAIEETIEYRGEPISVPHETAFLKMSKFMKQNISVVMSGEGADEMFAGYGRIFRSPHDFYISKKPLVGKLNNYLTGDGSTKIFSNPIDHFLSRYSWFTNEEKNDFLRKDIIKNNYDEYSIEYVKSLFNKISHLNYYEGMYYLLGKLHLTNLLNRLDRMTMASSVEARVPFLDVNLVEFASKIPTKYKLKWKNKFSKVISMFCNSETISEKHDIPKYILKRLAENKLPNSIIYRKNGISSSTK